MLQPSDINHGAFAGFSPLSDENYGIFKAHATQSQKGQGDFEPTLPLSKITTTHGSCEALYCILHANKHQPLRRVLNVHVKCTLLAAANAPGASLQELLHPHQRNRAKSQDVETSPLPACAGRADFNITMGETPGLRLGNSDAARSSLATDVCT